jgi:guanylate kinase
LSKQRLLVVSGPSGVGKGKLLNKLVQDFPHKFTKVVTYTTRPPRTNEISGLDYHFITREQMEKQIKNEEFIESVEICGDIYGSTIESVRNAARSGKICLLAIDVQGCEQIKMKAKELNMDVRYVFVAPPSFEEFKKYLKQRWASEGEEKINLRLKIAEMEMKYKDRDNFFDKIIVNKSFENTYEEFKDFLKNEINSTSNLEAAEEQDGVSADDEQSDSFDKSVLSLLFPHKKDNFDPLYEKYLRELTSYPLDKIVNEERVRLAEEREKIQKEMEDLAYKNYKTFIQTSECALAVKRQLATLEIGLEKLLTGMTSLSLACQDFCSRSVAIGENSKIVNTTLKHHSSLLELLELPQLIETCVKSQHYEEALELQQFAVRLYRNHPDITVIANIYDEVKNAIDIMVVQLHQQLCQNIHLSQYSRIIGYLKRLAVYSEKELRFCFLHCRDINLSNAIAVIPFANPYIYLTKLIDVNRTHIFDIVTQYRTIFDPEDTSEDDGILSVWMTEKISQFLQRIEKGLRSIMEGSSLLNIMNQCMHFGASLSRLGYDFRPLLTSIFESGVLNMFVNYLNGTKEQFRNQMARLSMHLATVGITSTVVLSTTSTKTSNVATSPLKEESNQLRPPTILLEFPPLAILVNGVLNALNEVRKCCLPTLQGPLCQAVVALLSVVLDEIINFKLSKEYSKLSQAEKENFGTFCRIMVEEVVPYLSDCLSALFYSSRRLIATDKIPQMETLKKLYEKSSSLQEIAITPEKSDQPENFS